MYVSLSLCQLVESVFHLLIKSPHRYLHRCNAQGNLQHGIALDSIAQPMDPHYLLALADFALKLLEQLLFLDLKCVVVLLKVYNLSTL